MGVEMGYLDEHECELGEGFGEPVYPFSDPCFCIASSKPSETRRSSRGNFLASSNHDEEVIPELPTSVDNARDPESSPDAQVRDRFQCGIPFFGVLPGQEMEDSVEDDGGHDMDEEGDDFLTGN
jgi:hypothetical protein